MRRRSSRLEKESAKPRKTNVILKTASVIS